MTVAAIVFLVDAGPRISAPFGNSQDGMNGAMWASGADAIVDDGLVESRLGAQSADRDVYAHHPPAIFVLTGLARAVGGSDEWVLRLPAVLASLLAIPLSWLLLRRLGCSTAATVCGLGALVGCQMFLVYGAMLNFEALSLPLAIATLLLVVEAPTDRRHRASTAFALGAASALVSWEGTLLCVVIVAASEWRRSRATVPHDSSSRWLGAGTLLGLMCTVGWLVWANRGIGEMWAALRTRTDTTTASLAGQIDTQITYLRIGFPIWWVALAVIGAVAAIREPRARRASHALLVVVPLVYLVGLPGGAYYHPYWNYWLVLTVAVFVATGVDRISRDLPRAKPALACSAVALLALAPHVDHSPARNDFVQGAIAAELVADHVDQGGTLWVWPALQEPNFWVTYYTSGPVEQLRTEDIADLAEGDPGREVLVWKVAVDRYEGPGVFDAVAAVAQETRGEYAIVRADRLASVVATN